MSRLEELRRQQVEIQKEIDRVKKDERAEALKTVKRLCKEFNFTASMLKDVLAEGRKPRRPKT